MRSISSGCYVIDADYNIVNANETALAVYPQLRIGAKCYACLMGLNAPCGPCPVANEVKGPQIYKDPIRGISETVDALELPTEEHGLCHALIFSTVGNNETFAATLPDSGEELHDLAMIQALTTSYYDVFTVELSTGSLTLYRHDRKMPENDSVYKHRLDYNAELEKYVEHYVHPEDREKVRRASSIDYMLGKLKEVESYKVHYRVMLHGELHYYFRKTARIGTADNFDNVVIGIGCEDTEMLSRLENEALTRSLSEVEINAMTGLYTQEAFLLRGAELLAKYPEKHFDYCILHLENLGLISYQYGGLAGEKLIRLIGRLLKLRDSETTCLAYVGNGMFASFTETTPREVRKSQVYDFRDEILRESEIKNVVLKWSIYVDVPRDNTVEEICAKTMFALSTLRYDVHTDYVEFDRAMIERMEWEAHVENTFEDAIAEKRFVAWYQPKYSIRTGKIVGAEALARCRDIAGSMIPPNKFIPVLEKCGKINQLDAYMFRTVCEMQRTIAAAGFQNVPISVNLSRASIFTSDIAYSYRALADEYGVAPSDIPIEITESAAVRAEAIGKFCNDLIGAGFKLHMDDFGAGYSSLASLQVIPFESIKLDKQLIDHIGRENSENLLKHTVAFAKESGKSVVAEGVENYEQYLFLKFIGCDMIQGYYFSKPVDEETFLNMLKEDRNQ